MAKQNHMPSDELDAAIHSAYVLSIAGLVLPVEGSGSSGRGIGRPCHLSAEEIAQAAGIGVRTIQRIEQGAIAKIKKNARAMRVLESYRVSNAHYGRFEMRYNKNA